MDRTSLYRAVWRWHFYAGVIVLPVLAWLAVTGAIYLYKPEIEAHLYGDLMTVKPAGHVLPATLIIAAAERGTGGKVKSFDLPADAEGTWKLRMEADGGYRAIAYVDPYRATVLGTTPPNGITQTVKNLHSLAITGPVGNAVVEIVAGWTILLVASGFYLWWPRVGNPAIGLRGKPQSRLFWRDLHASLGAVAGAVILFLALTGMPWTQVWGSGIRSIVAAAGAGRPPPPAVRKGLPWALQETGLGTGGPNRIDADRVIGIAARQGIVRDYLLVLPSEPHSPWLVATHVIRAEDARALIIDAQDGHLLQDVRFADFGKGAKMVEWGIATHQGQEYGEVNRLIMLAGCLSVLLLCVTAPVLWWKRRAGGTLRPPPVPDRPGALRGVAAIMLGLGVLFPLTGGTMVVALVAETLFKRRPS